MLRRRCAAGALRLHEGSSTAEACLTNHVRSTLFSCSRERVSRATIRCLQTSEHALSSSSLWVTGSLATAVGVGAGVWYSTQKIDCASGISNVRISSLLLRINRSVPFFSNLANQLPKGKELEKMEKTFLQYASIKQGDEHLMSPQDFIHSMLPEQKEGNLCFLCLAQPELIL